MDLVAGKTLKKTCLHCSTRKARVITFSFVRAKKQHSVTLDRYCQKCLERALENHPLQPVCTYCKERLKGRYQYCYRCRQRKDEEYLAMRQRTKDLPEIDCDLAAFIGFE